MTKDDCFICKAEGFGLYNHIANLLHQKGYCSFQDEKGILTRETEKIVYIVTLSVFESEIGPEDYEKFRMRIEFMVASRYHKRVCTLHLVITENGMFDDEVLQFVESQPEVWLVAADTGRIYIFENQLTQFDDLSQYLERGLKELPKGKHSNNSFRLQPVNMIIVSMNILYFFAVMILGGGYEAVYDTDIMLKMGALNYEKFMSGAWYEVVTSMFMHFGFSHLFNNMVLLIYAGCELEKRIGKISYLVIYLGTGICGNVASLWYYHHIGEYVISAGASGAIFGVIGSLAVVLITNRAKNETVTPKRLFLMAGMTIYYGMTTMGVDNAAHIGGILSGIIGGFLLSKISQYGKLK